jgi:hypothetical protein
VIVNEKIVIVARDYGILAVGKSSHHEIREGTKVSVKGFPRAKAPRAPSDGAAGDPENTRDLRKISLFLRNDNMPCVFAHGYSEDWLRL